MPSGDTRVVEKIMVFHWHIGLGLFKRIRVWYQIHGSREYTSTAPRIEIQKIIDYEHNQNVLLSTRNIAKRIALIPRVNAVEVMEIDSEEGIMIYPEWP